MVPRPRGTWKPHSSGFQHGPAAGFNGATSSGDVETRGNRIGHEGGRRLQWCHVLGGRGNTGPTAIPSPTPPLQWCHVLGGRGNYFTLVPLGVAIEGLQWCHVLGGRGNVSVRLLEERETRLQW